MSNGMLWRIALGIRGFRQLSLHYFGSDTHEDHHVRRAIRSDFPLWAMIVYKLQICRTGSKRDAGAFDELVRYHYDGKTWGDRFCRVVLLGIPLWALASARSVYRFFVWPLRGFREYQVSRRKPVR
jgi:hypothetical protein